ncbi:MAG TPA: hypothetical protein ENH82_08910 [bacterium]|nr:hypothetical protein [bacterium]
MKKILTALLLCFFLFNLAGSVYADKTIRYRNAKTLGMGDTRIAGGFGYNGFVDNPALLSRVGIVRFSILNLPVTINKNLVDIGKFIDENSDKFESYDDLTIEEKDNFIKDLQKHDAKWGRVIVSPMVDIAANIKGYGVGLAVFNTSDVSLKMDRGIYEPRVWGEGINNTVAVLGIAKPVFFFYPGLTVGVNLKYFQRRHASLFQIPASNLGNFDETVDPIIDEATNKQSTFAMDIGTLLEIPAINAEIGATIQSIGDGRGSSIDIGIAKRMASNRLVLLADYIDFFDNNKENFFNKIHMGAQYKYAVFALRAGFNSGYPTIGLGLNSRVIDIDAAYYIEELSKGPGGNDEPRFIVQIKLGW